jgi:hypothetical protein
MILQKLYKSNSKVITCGEINVNYMENCLKKVKLEDILSSYNLSSISFPTRIGPNTSTIMKYFLSNGLSDHEAQLLIVHLQTPIIKKNDIHYTRTVNYYNLADFRIKLSYENWESIFNNSDINTFNQFLNIFPRYFYASFPLSRRQKYKPNSWITAGIIISCRKKRVLYVEVKKTKNPKISKYYKKYFKTLTKVINLAKEMTYEKQIRN